jgi:hypothetical protein
MGSQMSDPDGMNAFLRITSSMREEDLKEKVKKEDMAQLIFGRDITE